MTLHGGYKRKFLKQFFSVLPVATVDSLSFAFCSTAFNRMGIDSNTSPLLKMSFETTATFLVSAATHGERDDLTSPASSIVLGKNATCGTGIFDCLQPLQIDDSQP
jgi:DNA-directed RNA polymerase I subunit RPA1